MVKGVPFKVQAAGDVSAICNVTVDGLLCMLNTDAGGSYENFLHLLYTELRSHAVEGYDYDDYEQIPNPYFSADSYLTMEYRFLPDHYTNNWNNLNVKLSYLVSHLDGIDLQNVYNIIDRSADATINENGWWIVDDDPDRPTSFWPLGSLGLDDLGVNIYQDNTNDWIFNNDIHNDEPVLGYVSWGRHAEDNNPDWHDSTYWVDFLNFQYAPGAVAATYESFNGNSMTTLVYRAEHGLITQSTELNLHNSGVSGFCANAWEPFDKLTMPGTYFISYAAGYNQIDAAYMGTYGLAWENVFQGDPFTRISDLITIDTLTGYLNANLDNVKVIVPPGGTLTISNDIDIIHFGGIEVFGKLIISSNVDLNLYNKALILVAGQGEIEFERNSSVILNNNSFLKSNGKIVCEQGVVFTKSNGPGFEISNKFFAEGDINNLINLNGIVFTNADSMLFNYVNFVTASRSFENDFRRGTLSIKNSNLSTTGMIINNFNKVILEDNSLSNITDDNTPSVALNIFHNHHSVINRCSFNNVDYGIKNNIEGNFVNVMDTLIIKNCDFTNVNNGGIALENIDPEFHYVYVDSTIFDECNFAININNFDYCSPIISNCILTNFGSTGISLTNGSSALINYNQISTSNSSAENPIGIYLSQVTGPHILWNTITTDVSEPGSGIVSVSSGGEYKSNLISGYYNGIELGNSSSPYVALNQIYQNKKYGIYVSTGSNPKLNKGLSGGTGYPLSGYNEIYENGTPTQLLADPEIYLNNANIQLSKGCNTIADDRNDLYDHKILIDGINVRYDIIADSNYWGNHPIYGHNPAQRFGTGLRVRYSPYDTMACSYSQGSSLLLLTTTTGIISDTLFSDGSIAYQLPPIEEAYSDANQYFYSGDYTEAENIYKQIINGSEDSTYSMEAYNGLYLIKKYQNANSQSYENLRQYYQGKLSSIEDTSILLAVKNLSDLCRISKNEFDQAINSFDETAQNNPGTDIELYNEINAFTTALLIDSTGGLGKSAKYGTGDISEYLKNVSNLLKTRGKNIENDPLQLIPTEFYLYQNYPNPFNPITTIKYAIPKTVRVELKVFDILGREVKTLINELKNSGYYQVQFNAENYASGVYFYRIKAGEYIKTNKMLLLK